MQFTDSAARKYTAWWEIDSRDHTGLMIGTDFHAPHHSALWCNRLLGVAQHYGICTLLIAGDGLDMAAFSSWGADPEQSWTQEMSHAAQWLWVIYHSFDRVLWLRGNHEDRLARATNWQLSAGQLTDAILTHKAREMGEAFTFEPERMQFSPYPQCTIDGEWLVVHPRSYSRIRGRIANQIAMIRQKHVIAAHSHLANKGWSDDGRHITIDTGGMFDEDLIQYRSMSVTTHPAWNHGFVAYREGNAVLFSDTPYTDWSVLQEDAA